MGSAACRAAAAALLLAPGPCRAAQHIEDTVPQRWEFGVDFGALIPRKKYQFSHDIPNTAAIAALFNETAGDEIAEGFVPPPSAGSSTVAGSMKTMGEFSLHGYYHTTDWLSLGLEGGWAPREDLRPDNQGNYGGLFPGWGNRQDAEVFHVAPLARLGGWIGPFRPYLSLGPELSIFHDQVLIQFSDVDDPGVPSYTAIDEYRYYVGANGGAGLEWRVAPTGTLQLSCQYHLVYAPGQVGRFDYLTPRLSFVVYF